MKKIITVLITLCMLLSLFACSKSERESDVVFITPQVETAAPEAVFALSPEEQTALMESLLFCWNCDSEYEKYSYAVTDLDANGRWELFAAITQGTGIFSTGRLFEVSADGKNLTEIPLAQDEGGAIPEVIVETADRYTAPDSGVNYYIFQDDARSGSMEGFSAKTALSLQNGAVSTEVISSLYYTVEDGETRISYSAADGSPITQEQFNSCLEQRFAGYAKSQAHLGWFVLDMGDVGENLAMSRKVFSGEAASMPVPEAEPVSAPDLESVSQPAETPASVSEPAVPIGSSGNITVTKNPTGEALTIGGKTWFIAHASNADTLLWQLLDPHGRVYSVQEAMNANPGLVLEVLEGDTIAVSNVPLSLNGWSIQAVFSNVSFSAATSPAEIYVGDYTAAYASVIGRYKSAFENGIGSEADAERFGVSEMSAYSRHVGYAMKDLDKNGTPEIIIAATGEGNNAGKIIYEIATLDNGSVHSLCMSRARDRFYLRTDSCIYEQGSNGAAYSIYRVFKLTSGNLSLTEELRSDLDDQARAVWYYTVSGQESVIGESDAFARIDGYEGILYVPFMTTIA